MQIEIFYGIIKVDFYYIMAEKKNLRLDLTDFNISLVEILSFLKEKGEFFGNIFNSHTTEKHTNHQKDVNINQSFEEEKVDLTKLKLNIEALKNAVKVAKQTKGKKNN